MTGRRNPQVRHQRLRRAVLWLLYLTLPLRLYAGAYALDPLYRYSEILFLVTLLLLVFIIDSHYAVNALHGSFLFCASFLCMLLPEANLDPGYPPLELLGNVLTNSLPADPAIYDNYALGIMEVQERAFAVVPATLALWPVFLIIYFVAWKALENLLRRPELP